METVILYSETSNEEKRRIAGVYGNNLDHSDKYEELTQLLKSEPDRWDAIMDFNPFEEFVTFNIEDYFFEEINVTVSDGRFTRTPIYNQIDGKPARIPETGDEELLQKYIKDNLESQDLDRLRERNVRGFDAKLEDNFFKEVDQLNPEEAFR